ncbi:hypothetical protein BC834DRAFT_981033 [Gloeopeniophorella convolvens]|nr:hypothetical protein BC834DRAFT_981033 [Gloeopeniophorella convolvens]
MAIHNSPMSPGKTCHPKAGGPWDIQMRRNFGDMMHEREDMHFMWGPDAPHVPPSTALNHFAIALTGFVTSGLLFRYALVPDRPPFPVNTPSMAL